jgi:hypothetical protein
MKCLVSMAAVGLSMVLLMPLGAAAQAEMDHGLEVSDPVGDLLATVGPLPVDGVTSNEPAPAHLDITRLGLITEGSDLIVTFEVAGDIPERDPTVREAYYALLLERGHDTYQAEARQSEGWKVALTTFRGDEPWGTASGRRPQAERSGNRLVMRVPLEPLGTLDDVRFLAYSSAVRDCTPDDPCDVVGADAMADVPFVWWTDAVPGEDGLGDDGPWLTWDPEPLATSDPVASDG